MDAVIPTEIGFPMIRTIIRGQKDENLELERNLDWADEVRENAYIRIAAYQQRAVAITTARHDPESSRSEHLSLGKFSKTPPKRESGSSKQIGKTLTLSLKQVKTGVTIYKS